MLMLQSKILLIDDHSLVREGIKFILQKNEKFIICAEAGDGLDGIERIKQTQPDIVITDLSIPGINGIEILKFIRANFPHIKTLVLTMHDEAEYVLSAIELGANGYLLKNSDLSELERAVLAIRSGNNFYSKHISNIMALGIKMKNKNLLTQREKQVLSGIVKGQSNKATAEILKISIKTVSVHRTNIMKKLNAANTADLVRITIENKLI